MIGKIENTHVKYHSISPQTARKTTATVDNINVTPPIHFRKSLITPPHFFHLYLYARVKTVELAYVMQSYLTVILEDDP